MGLCSSAPAADGDREARHKNLEIDRHIDESSRRRRKEAKVLLLGSGESGKSTIVKQIKVIHLNGYTHEELYMYRLTVIKNVIDSVHAMILALRKFGLDPQLLENRVRTRRTRADRRRRVMRC